MEKIYDPNLFQSTEHLSIKEYFAEYTEGLFAQLKQPIAQDEDSINNEILQLMDVESMDEATKHELIESCSYEHLAVPGERNPIDPEVVGVVTEAGIYKCSEPAEDSKDGVHLRTIQELKERLNRDPDPVFVKRYADINVDKSPLPKTIGEPNLKIGEDYIIYLRLFKPFEHAYCYRISNDLRYDQEVAILGTNTIADFRDKIICIGDLTVPQELSENPSDVYKLPVSKDLYPSGFIFIDGVFYNDFRHEKSIDYSEEIINWASERNIGAFEKKDMTTVRFETLKPRFGYPYIYMHRGCCEHIFIFSHARLINSQDPLCSAVYPYYSNVGYKKTVNCSLCGTFPAAWYVTECDRLPTEALLCQPCFLSYCYTDGKKNGEFKAYDFRKNKNVHEF